MFDAKTRHKRTAEPDFGNEREANSKPTHDVINLSLGRGDGCPNASLILS
jgi:hypothetical protein